MAQELCCEQCFVVGWRVTTIAASISFSNRVHSLLGFLKFFGNPEDQTLSLIPRVSMSKALWANFSSFTNSSPEWKLSNFPHSCVHFHACFLAVNFARCQRERFGKLPCFPLFVLATLTFSWRLRQCTSIPEGSGQHKDHCRSQDCQQPWQAWTACCNPFLLKRRSLPNLGVSGTELSSDGEFLLSFRPVNYARIFGQVFDSPTKASLAVVAINCGYLKLNQGRSPFCFSICIIDFPHYRT